MANPRLEIGKCALIVYLMNACISDLFPNITSRRVAWNFNEGLFWRPETTSNDLDPDFDRSSIRLSRFLCPNIGDLQK